MGALWGQLVGGELGRKVDVSNLPGLRVGDFEEWAVFAHPEVDGWADFQSVELPGIDLLGGVFCNLFEAAGLVVTEIEAMQPLASLCFASGNTVEVLFEPCGVVVVD